MKPSERRVFVGHTPKPLSAKEKWPELQRLAEDIARKACSEINLRAPLLPAEGMPYKQQCTLEMLIDELQRRV